MGKTYRQKLDEYFENEDVKAFLSALLGYLGVPADRAPASSALTACVAYYLHGGYFPRGGAQRFADSLRGFIEGHGGAVLTGRRVSRILVEDGRVRGVEAGGQVFRSPIVVFNGNAKLLQALWGRRTSAGVLSST